ncbi:MAG: manganese efflux pump MntP family protein [Clostridiales bacterium]|jgi:putative Mn2+ efflux pump MntP|nr:manganese efflux pump MntP family protein [Clostridiales bacterium]
MGWIELFLIAVGLSMDAFAVAAGKGLAMPDAAPKARVRGALVVGLYFGLFQALMPLAGYFLGARFSTRIGAFDHWVAFGLLAFIGARMVLGGRKSEGKQPAAAAVTEAAPEATAAAAATAPRPANAETAAAGPQPAGSTPPKEQSPPAEPSSSKGPLSPKEMLPLAVATSIDALAVGVTFAFLNVRISVSVVFIGCVTFCISVAGVFIGNALGSRFRARAELLGGFVLILIGAKTLVEHLLQ